MSVVRSLRVDELDIKEGDVSLETNFPESPFMQPRMADQPHSFSTTTTVPSSTGETGRVGGRSPPPLSKRFVRSGTPEPSPERVREEVKRQKLAESGKSSSEKQLENEARDSMDQS